MLEVKQVSFTDVLRGYNARSRVRLSYLDVRTEVANCCLPFKGFKRRNNLQLIYLKVWLTSLGTKKQKRRNDCLFLRINCSKQCTRDLLRGWNASSELLLIHLEGLKHRERYDWWFWRLNDIEKVMRDNFTRSKTLIKVETMYLELKLIED